MRGLNKIIHPVQTINGQVPIPVSFVCSCESYSCVLRMSYESKYTPAAPEDVLMGIDPSHSNAADLACVVKCNARGYIVHGLYLGHNAEI